jgi:hypothetical protein
MGDKWGFYRTAIVREFPFPRFEGEKFVPEALVWNRIARRWRMRFVDEVLKISEYQPDGLTGRSIPSRAESPKGVRLYYTEVLQDALSSTQRWRASANAVRFACHEGKRGCAVLEGIPMRPSAVAGIPVGLWLAWRDRGVLGRETSRS